MKIQFASDIHLELSDNSRFIKSETFEVTGDVLVFAGDTGYLRDRTLPNLKFWKWASANYREVLLVPGNHEFYGNGDVLAYGDSWSREILPNVHYHQNKVVRIDNVDFILSTLWSHIRPEDEYLVHRGMNDFRQILYNGRRFTSSQSKSIATSFVGSVPIEIFGTRCEKKLFAFSTASSHLLDVAAITFCASNE